MVLWKSACYLGVLEAYFNYEINEEDLKVNYKMKINSKVIK